MSLLKNKRKFFLWLMLFIAAILWKYGYSSAPKAFFAISFFYVLTVYTFMAVPFLIGSAGFRKLRSHLTIAVLVPFVIAILYQLLFKENILRLWYQGAFDREYIYGLLQAAVIVPVVSFLFGLMLRER